MRKTLLSQATGIMLAFSFWRILLCFALLCFFISPSLINECHMKSDRKPDGFCLKGSPTSLSIAFPTPTHHNPPYHNKNWYSSCDLGPLPLPSLPSYPHLPCHHSMLACLHVAFLVFGSHNPRTLLRTLIYLELQISPSFWTLYPHFFSI